MYIRCYESSVSIQALWLDADVEGVKAAEGAGMKAVLVENLDAALEKLSEFTGFQVCVTLIIFSDAVGLKTLTFRSNYNKENDYINNICIRLNLQAVGTVSPPPACSPDEVSHGYITIKVLISISASNLLNYENTTQS